ncbi:hypothetical protein BC939DRAFT_211372 [Gamsiella multidivaricata]|uniref:uncharacterized protein n=1 Tax=Gamsiella multidivaricata TaxID=101098 RepID=UPI00222109E7|nr:uncharacterized protein BC939DRAFT_211372 [Gamsiella multidivaricata]KAI7821031.1 hypothetical protein BC939DRAFT_211372 [Gamsiella multidivaricata]
MAKRQNNGQIRQLAPLRASTSSNSVIPSPSPAPQSDPESSSPSAAAKKSFWTTAGMDTFIDWITDPHSHQRLHAKNPIAGQKAKDVHTELANLVNKKHGTAWDYNQIKSKLAYVRSKYREACKLSSTGEGNTGPFGQDTLLSRQKLVCPHFERIHVVYGGSLSANPPPPRQTVFYRDERAMEETDGECSDLEAIEDTPHANPIAGAHIDDGSTGPPSKRQKDNGLSTLSAIAESMTELSKMANQSRQAHDEDRNLQRLQLQAIERRERELVQRELGLGERLVRLEGEHQEMLNKRERRQGRSLGRNLRPRGLHSERS